MPTLAARSPGGNGFGPETDVAGNSTETISKPGNPHERHVNENRTLMRSVLVIHSSGSVEDEQGKLSTDGLPTLREAVPSTLCKGVPRSRKSSRVR